LRIDEIVGKELFEVPKDTEKLCNLKDQELLKAMSFCHDVTPRNDEMLFSTIEGMRIYNGIVTARPQIRECS
jgi:hypothetical protein